MLPFIYQLRDNSKLREMSSTEKKGQRKEEPPPLSPEITVH